MSKNLVIVESPAKARTIKRYLGKDYQVLASYGHVRDLIPKGGAVDPEQGFAMKYELIARNHKHVNTIARAAKQATELYLATDPDREGEAISWHVCNVLRERGVLAGKGVHRVVFHEITKSAIRKAMETPRELSEPLINAQQARRALDYLVGFNLSPLLWKKIKRGLSAGRVQSPALRMIAEREEEIAAFKPREYWTIAVEAAVEEQTGEAPTVQARLARYAGEKSRAVHLHERSRRARGRSGNPPGGCRGSHCSQGREEAAAAPPRGALHDIDASAGSGAQAPLQRAKNHVSGAAAL